MKNIHVLPIDKPSRLFLNKVNNKLLLEYISNPSLKNVLLSGSYHNIYITSDEEIKEGDWFYSVRELIEKAIINYPKGEHFGKVILTTDQDLIKYGIQDIDDEFLEWFVKNPSCESVEVQKWSSLAECGYSYHIIISKEEPKHPKVFSENGNELFFDEQGNLIKEEPKQIKCYCGHTITCDCGPLEEPKQETLEEAAERLFPDSSVQKRIFIKGAKWQQGRSYTEEEVVDIMFELLNQKREECCITHTRDSIVRKLFEQFKKK